MHIQGFNNHHQTVILRFGFFQQLQCFLIHYVIMEAPAAGTGIALFFQIFLGIVFVHSELRRIFAQLVCIILAGSIHENAAHSLRLYTAEQRGRIFTGKILIHNQMRTECSIQALRCRHGRGIIPVHMRITDNKTIQKRSSFFGNIMVIVVDVITVHGFQNQQNNSVILRFDFGNLCFRLINAHFRQTCFILGSQLALLHMLAAGNFIRIKNCLADKVHINRNGKHIAIVHARLFVLYLSVHTDNIFHAVHAGIAKQSVGKVQAQGEHGHTKQRPGKVRLTLLRFRYIKQQ